MNTSIIILLILFASVNFLKISGSYRLDYFIKEIKSNGVYDLLLDVKYTFGDDVSIQTCYLIYPTNDCEKVILYYMPAKSRAISYVSISSSGIEIPKATENVLKLWEVFIKHSKKLKIKIDIPRIVNAVISLFPRYFQS